MILQIFKEYIEKFPENTLFRYGLSDPFSWRGAYDEVAFTLLDTPMTKEELLSKINEAYTKTFRGYKGGEYTYDDYTVVNFESSPNSWTDGDYVLSKIKEIENYKDTDESYYLVSLAFKQ